MSKEATQGLFRLARNFFFGTLLSRFGGMAREMVMAFCFGATAEVGAFFVAYRLANLFRRLLGEGNAQAGFIPQFEALKKRGERESFLFYRDVIWSSGLVLAVVVLLWILSFRELSHWLNPTWEPLCLLTNLMVPSLFFLGLYALQAGLLQCQKKTFWAAFAPVFFNLSWIVAALFAKGRSQPMELLALGVTGACAVQWFACGRHTFREWKGILSWRDWLQPRLFTADWRALLKPMGLGIVGVAAVQINSALDVLFARFSDLSGPAYLAYAMRVYQLPLALFGIALSGTLLAPLTRALVHESEAKGAALLQTSLELGAKLMILCTAALLAFGPCGLNLLYGRGSFEKEALEKTLWCLWGYGLGLFPTVQTLVLTQGYYARGKYAVPAFVSCGAVLLNISLNSWFVFGLKWGALSVSIATSLTAWIQYWILRWRNELVLSEAKKGMGQILAVSILIALTSLALQYFLFPWLPRALSTQLWELSLIALLFGGTIGWIVRKHQHS